MRGIYRRGGKRAFDIAASGTAMVVLSPVLLAVASLVRWRMGRPVLFKQQRSGRDALPFTIYKFRTMRQAGAGNPGQSDSERLTGLGRWLRRTSLDELPELFNVLRGDMSLVGPRPLLPHYLPYYRPHERARFEVRPGITGWAQVNGRNEASWDDRLARDVWYAQAYSFGLDLRILLRTMRQVMSGAGVIDDPRSAMPDLDQERALA